MTVARQPQRWSMIQRRSQQHWRNRRRGDGQCKRIERLELLQSKQNSPTREIMPWKWFEHIGNNYSPLQMYSFRSKCSHSTQQHSLLSPDSFPRWDGNSKLWNLGQLFRLHYGSPTAVLVSCLKFLPQETSLGLNFPGKIFNILLWIRIGIRTQS